jgi:MOSC domain-containing protein YiiM
MPPRVVAVSSSNGHTFSKSSVRCIHLLVGLGVQGDAHCGSTVKHRSRVAQDPTQPNLRQVHLIHSELFAELHAKGFRVEPGQLGENITTAGIDLLSLPLGTELVFGQEATLRLTGLRNPCAQLDRFRPGLMAAVLDRLPEGKLVRKAGVMSIVLAGGPVRPGDEIRVTLPAQPHQPLEPI